MVKFKIILYFKYYIYIQLVGEYFFSCRTICNGGVLMFTVVRLLWYWRTRPLGIYVVGIIENTRLASIRYWPAYRQVLLSIQDSQVLHTGLTTWGMGCRRTTSSQNHPGIAWMGGGSDPCLDFCEGFVHMHWGPSKVIIHHPEVIISKQRTVLKYNNNQFQFIEINYWPLQIFSEFSQQHVTCCWTVMHQMTMFTPH